MTQKALFKKGDLIGYERTVNGPVLFSWLLKTLYAGLLNDN